METAPEDDQWGQAAQPPAAEPPDLSVLRLNRRPPPAFPLDVLGDRWAAWTVDTAASSACPIDYVAGPLLATGSALIGNARWARGVPGWDEPPILWVASIGDSGSGKSPGGDAIFGHVVPELERRMAREFPDAYRDWETAKQAAKAKESAWHDAVAAAVEKGEPVPLKPDDLNPGPEPQRPRLRQSDVTIEKVAQLLAQSAPKGLLMVRDELAGFMLGMNKYHDGARQFWLETYGGRNYKVERVKLPEPLDVPHMTCAWFGTIQPDRLASLTHTASPRHTNDADDGLLARFIFFWPDRIPFRLSSTSPDIEFASEALDRLRALEMYRTDGRLAPIKVPLVSTALPHMVAFARAMEARQETTEGLLNSAYGKARGLALRLSLVIEFLRWAAEPIDPFNADPPIVISEASFLAACRLAADYLMPMAERTYGDAGALKPERDATTLARWIARADPRPAEVHVRTLQRTARLPGLKRAEEIHAACRELIEAGWLLPAPRIGGNDRERRAYPIRPALWASLDALR